MTIKNVLLSFSLIGAGLVTATAGVSFRRFSPASSLFTIDGGCFVVFVVSTGFGVVVAVVVAACVVVCGAACVGAAAGVDDAPEPLFFLG